MSDGLNDSRPQVFTDDSSSSMGLSHSAKAPSAEVFDRGGDRLAPVGSPLRDRELEERKLIVVVEGEVRERLIAKALANLRSSDHNATRKQAEAAVELERRNKQQARDKKSEARAERKEKELRQLMGTDLKPSKHGSSKGRTRTGKKGTWICGSCHLEFCIHRPVKKKSGRSAHINARISKGAKARLADSDMTPGQILEAVVATAIRNGCSPGMVIGMLDEIAKGEAEAA